MFFVKIFISRFLLYWFTLKSLFLLTLKKELNEEFKKQLNVSKFFFFLSLGSLVIMILSPEFRFRSTFHSLFFLLISLSIARKVKFDHSFKYYVNDNKKMKLAMKFIAIVYICFTVLSTLFMYDLQRKQTQIVLSQIEEERNNLTKAVLVVRERPALIDERLTFVFLITGGHVPYPKSLTVDENYWINRDISIYYNIRGIRAAEQ